MKLDISGTPALVTGASRGLGRALVDELLRRDCPLAFATMRDPDSMVGNHVLDPRERRLPMDIADSWSVADAYGAVRSIRQEGGIGLLINNAGVAAPDWDTNYETNVLGTRRVTETFLPLLVRHGPPCAIVHVMTIYALANPGGPMTDYAGSKALLHSDTQGLRKDLGDSCHVAGVYAGPIRTRMTAVLDIDKAEPADVARGICDGLEDGLTHIYPDPIAAHLGGLWEEDPRGLEEVIQ